MSELEPYSTGSTGTLADVVEQGPQLKGVSPAGPGSFAPPADFGDLFHSYRVENRAYRTDFGEIKLRDGYAPIIDALGLGASENPSAFSDSEGARNPILAPSGLLARQGKGWLESMTDRSTQEYLIAQEIRSRRAKQPDFLPDVPDTVDGLHRYFDQNEVKARQVAAATIARGPGGLRQALTGLAGGGFEAFHDPFNIATLPIGGGGRTVVQVVAREALVNGLLEAAQLPVAAQNLSELGAPMTAGDAAFDVASAGVFGGLVGGVIHVAGEHVPPAVFGVMPETVQKRWADRMKIGGGKQAPLLKDVIGDMDNRELAGFARSTIGERMTPDEKAAAATLEREQEMGEASPFLAGPAGDGAHNASLGDSLKAIIDGADRPAPRATLGNALLTASSLTAPGLRSPAPGRVAAGAVVPHDIVDFFKAKGLDDARAYGIAAGIMAESGGDHTVVNRTSGAAFLGQWMGPRLEAIKARFGPNPSRADQLEFLWHELSGGDKGGKFVMAAKTSAEALDAYIRKFMRPHAGAETIGDLERGMAALGRKGEIPDGGPGGADVTGVDASVGEDAAIAALRREGDAAEAEAIAAAQQREAGDALDVEQGHASALDSADYPILKRDIFDSDRDWFDAQIGFYRSQGLVADVADAAANRSPARAASVPIDGQPGAAKGAEIAADEPHGPFGPEFPLVEGNWSATLAALRDARTGVVPGAIDHPDLGLIDLPWGEAGRGKSDGFGLAKLEAHHPEVVDKLPEIVRGMSVKSSSGNRVRLESADHEAAVRLDWNGEKRNWLLTAYGKPGDVKKAAAPVFNRKAGAPLATVDERAANAGQDGSPDRGAASDIAAAGPLDNPELKAFEAGGRGRVELVDSLEHDLRANAQAATARSAAAVEPLDRGAAIDPAIHERQGQQAKLGAAAPLRARSDINQLGEIGLALFDKADQPEFIYRVGEDGDEKTLKQILDGHERERAALDALRDCANPKGGGA